MIHSCIEVTIGKCPSMLVDLKECETGGSCLISANVQNANIIIESGQNMSVSFGWVCGVDIGLPVLYASDGALITIDGQYLIVQK